MMASSEVAASIVGLDECSLLWSTKVLQSYTIYPATYMLSLINERWNPSAAILSLWSGLRTAMILWPMLWGAPCPWFGLPRHFCSGLRAELWFKIAIITKMKGQCSRTGVPPWRQTRGGGSWMQAFVQLMKDHCVDKGRQSQAAPVFNGLCRRSAGRFSTSCIKHIIICIWSTIVPKKKLILYLKKRYQPKNPFAVTCNMVHIKRRCSFCKEPTMWMRVEIAETTPLHYFCSHSLLSTLSRTIK